MKWEYEEGEFDNVIYPDLVEYINKLNKHQIEFIIHYCKFLLGKSSNGR